MSVSHPPFARSDTAIAVVGLTLVTALVLVFNHVAGRAERQLAGALTSAAGHMTSVGSDFGPVDSARRSSATPYAGGAGVGPGSTPAANAPFDPVAANPVTVKGGVPMTRDEAVLELRERRLTLPVKDVAPEALVASFDAKRGARRHEALDILSPRGTPVFAVEDGTVARLFWSDAGGHTIYQFDPTGRYCYYYAHLDKYADGLAEGQRLRRGQVIAYVGFTGNANASTPHLHFAIVELTPEKRWWVGRAIDPYFVLR